MYPHTDSPISYCEGKDSIEIRSRSAYVDFFANEVLPDKSLKMKAITKYCLLFGLFLPGYASIAIAQITGWEKVFGGEHKWTGNIFQTIDTIDDEGKHVIQTSDGGYLLAANTDRSFTGFGGTDVLLLKLTPEGDTSWSALIGDTADQTVMAVQQTTDGGYIFAGQTWAGGMNDGDSWLVKTDAFGNVSWQKQYADTIEDGLHDVKQTSDGGYIAVGQVNDTDSTFAENYYVIKTNSTGDTTWTKRIGTKGFDDWAYEVQIVGTTGYLIGGFTASFGAGSRDFWFVRTDLNGDTIWTRTFGGSGNERMNAVKPTSDGGFVGVGQTPSFQAGLADVYIAKINSLGDSVWTKYYGTANEEIGYDIWETSDKGFVIAAFTNSFGAGGKDAWLLRTDSLGDTTWTKTFGNGGDEEFESAALTSDGGFVFTGFSNSHSPAYTWKSIYVVKTDTLGKSSSNMIHGVAFHDANSNCIYDTSETVFPNNLVEVNPGPIYTTTDSNGRFSVLVPAGTYTATITTVPRSNYWNLTCPPSGSQTVSFTASFDSLEVDFGFEEAAFCPLMVVDISAPDLQQCENRTFNINYCNYGTVSADSSAVEIIFDPWLNVDSASIPWQTPQSGNTYVFDLDTVPVGHCGLFQVFVTVSCSAATGQSHCSQARIFPDSSCFLTGGGWDGSTITVSGKCIANDTVRFTIKNEGSANMLASGGFVVIEDIVLKPVGTLPNPFVAGDSLVVDYPANGSTWTLKATQGPGHPLASSPSSSVEGCGLNGQGIFSKGFLTMYPQFSGRYSRDYHCAENILPAIPGKYAFPKGAPGKNYIEHYDDIDYVVQFENITGQTVTDVLIRDTLPPELNIKSVIIGSSSHPVRYSVVGPGILQWEMNNVSIPDVSVNPDAANGFIRFHVKQNPGNPVGTIIDNRATVQLNFGAADPTPVVTLRIGDSTIQVDPPVFFGDKRFAIWPNPAESEVNVEFESETSNVRFEILGMNGELLLHTEMVRSKFLRLFLKDISPGIYVFRISSSGNAIGAGKLVVIR